MGVLPQMVTLLMVGLLPKALSTPPAPNSPELLVNVQPIMVGLLFQFIIPPPYLEVLLVKVQLFRTALLAPAFIIPPP